MYKNYAITAWRNLVKNKVFSFINISGLALGLTCSVLIGLWVFDEYSIDAFHENSDRIYVVTSCSFSGDEMEGSYDTPGLLGEELPRVMPQVEYACNYAWNSFHTFAAGDKITKLEGNFAGADFFKIFSYPLLLGTKETALNTPLSIAISKKMATNLFGSPEQAMGRSVRFENYRELQVMAVFDDLKDNASEKFEYLINWDLFVERNPWVKNWNNSGPYTFIKLAEHADAKDVGVDIRHFIKNYDKEYSDIERLELGLQLFREKYLHSNFKDGHLSGGRIEYVRLFSFVAVFILLIACINFMNLSTARSFNRAKEIGVRKVIGAVRLSLINQFMLEALLCTAIAVFFAMVLIFLLLPHFNLLTSKNIDSPLNNAIFWMAMLALTLVTGFISGSYPALLLSSFKPFSMLKRYFNKDSSSVILRKGLVVLQFALSIIFIVGMIVVSRQVDFIHNKNIGYQKDNLIYLPLTGNIAENYNAFKHEALKIPGVLDISKMSQRPVEIDNSTGNVDWEGKPPGTRPLFTTAAVGFDFVKTMQATLLSGRDFSPAYNDSASFIINETALRTVGYEDPIGKPLTFWGIRGTIIGVVRDFHFNSLHVPITPLILRVHTGLWGTALIRTAPEKTAASIEALGALHKKMNPDFIFAHQFASEEYAFLYRSEQIVKQLSGYFAFLAVFISCLGLLGLVIFTAEQRTKEVGIRKVLGASLQGIVALLAKDFMKLVVISAILSMPVAYYVMELWLGGFKYRIDMQWWMFALAASAAILIALLTVCFQGVKTASMNPADSLRSE